MMKHAQEIKEIIAHREKGFTAERKQEKKEESKESQETDKQGQQKETEGQEEEK